MTELSLVVSQNWIYVFIYASAMWFLLFIYRKSYKNKTEIKRQVALGFISIIVGSVGDVIGTTLNLWHFLDGDIPAISFLIYFFGGMAGYNIVKLIDKYI